MSIFISFEGIDGAGKSTHIDALAAAFKAEHGADKVVLTREPGGTPLAEKLRQLILNDAMDALTESFLVFAARRDHLNLVIEPALARGDVVLSDRFTDATFAYQGGGRGFDLKTLSTLERYTQEIRRLEADLVLEDEPVSIRQPNLTIWFDLPPEIAAERLAGARVVRLAGGGSRRERLRGHAAAGRHLGDRTAGRTGGVHPRAR